MGGKSGKQVVGYRYFMGLHFGICHGPVDELKQIQVGEREAWAGSVTDNDTIAIEADDLFGGTKREGGIEGDLDVMMGGPAQTANAYLSSKIDGLMPAFRGILSCVYNGGYIAANNPYVKPWAFKVKRILEGWHGGAAWYPEKAPVPIETLEETSYTYEEFDTGFSTNAPTKFELDDGDLLNTTVDAAVGNQDYWSTTLPTNFVVNSVEAEFSVISAGRGDPIGFFLQPANNSRFIQFMMRAEDGFDAAYKPYINYWEDDALPAVAVHTSALSIGQVYRFEAILDRDAEEFTYFLKDDEDTEISTGTEPLPNGDPPVYLTFGRTSNSHPPDIARGIFYWVRISGTVQGEAMNPAHIVYQGLTDPNWGMGYPTAQVDETSFASAADTFYAEGLGLCLIWNQQSSIEDFIQQVLDHAGAVLYADPKTGKFKLKALRADYDVEYLPVYDESNILSLDKFERPGYGETINEITVVYNDIATSKDSPITVQDLANIQAQGGVVSQTRQYPGLPTSTLAARIAERDLIAVSTPLAKCQITVNRQAWEEAPGGVIKVNWDKLGLEAIIFRVLTINYGNLNNGQLVIELAEDVYGLPSSSYSQQQQSGFVEPTITPSLITIKDVLEAPYWDVARRLSAADLSFLDADSAFVMAVASTSNPVSLGFEMFTRISPAEYASADALGTFAPTAVVAGSVGFRPQDTVLEYTDGVDIQDIVPGQRALIGSGRSAEFVEVVDLSESGSEIEFKRGILDTTPQYHYPGTRIFFMENNFAADPTERATGDSVDVKLSAYAGGGQTSLSAANAMNIEPDQRLYRPYPPGNVLLNGDAFPTLIIQDVDVTWAHRDRLQQLASYVDQDDASIGPEAGTTYTIRYYLESALIDTESGITGTAATNYQFPISGTWTIELESVRDGVTSWQPQARTFEVIADPSYEFIVEQDLPVGYWPLDDTSGTTAVARIGANGTYTSGPTLNQSGIVENTDNGVCPDFDGTNDHVLISSAVLASGNLSAYTLECWASFDTLTNTPMLIQQQNAGETNSNAGFHVSAAGALTMDEFPPTAQTLASANGTIATGTIYHLVAVKAPGIRELWANNVMVANDTSPETYTGGAITKVKLGGGFGAANRIDGKLAHCAIYNYRLTSAQIADHYNAGVGT